MEPKFILDSVNYYILHKDEVDKHREYLEKFTKTKLLSLLKNGKEYRRLRKVDIIIHYGHLIPCGK